MGNLIRDTESTQMTIRRRKTGRGFWSVALIIGAILVGGAALIVAVLNAGALGWPAYIMLVGLAALAVIALMTAGQRDGHYDGRSSLIKGGQMSREAFDAMKAPALIVQNGNPRRANRAYLDLVAELGVQGLSDSPPTVDRLFGNADPNTASAIFRLHHMRPDATYTEEIIETLTPEGALKRYCVAVEPIKNGQLWQVKDLTQSGSAEIETLVDAPVGLFAISGDGAVIAMNSVLLRWLGVEPSMRPGNVSEFIENPDGILNSPKSAGRTVRTETRLVTQKGIVTPSILVGTWRELSSGDLYASLAVYGHTNMASVPAAAPAPLAVPSLGGETLANGGDAPPKSYSAAPFGILNLDRLDLAEAVIQGFNPAMKAICGGNLSVGDRFEDLFSGGTHPPAFLKKGATIDNRPKDAVLSRGDERPVNVYIVQDGKAGCLVYLVDVSQRRELEQQLVQSQKMQAIGQLAGGVAHDFNNLLTAIRLNTDELLGRHPVGDPSYPELQKINATVNRAAGLVKKLLAFSRKQTLRTETLDVSDTLSDVSVMLRDLLNDKINLEVVHGRSLPAFRADKNQFDNALMNLCVNARDAMMEQGGGIVTLRSSKATSDDLTAEGVDSPTQGDFIRIEVTDTGTGMDEATQAKIFEPFFTTKELGKGTGLGLATVYGIMQQSGGYLTVDSALGVGTTFKLYWPVADPDDIATNVVPIRPERKRPADLSGNGRILFVEDEDAVRTIAAKTLRKRGYDVTEACDGEEAYEILQDMDEPFDLMISDVVMPGMDGPTLLKTARSLIGEARIVFISGYAEEEFSELLSEEPDVTFLPKPFTLTQLAERVKTEIGEV